MASVELKPATFESFELPTDNGRKCRVRLTLEGVVQGVGFRPYVHRLANQIGVSGWVRNSVDGVHIEAEGSVVRLNEFLHRLPKEIPIHASIRSCRLTRLNPAGHSEFKILKSEQTGPKSAHLLPDLATCPDCLRELFDPQNRRYRYPFTNCTNCGPRYSIIESLPYDRGNTTMKLFAMCGDCQSEYDDPNDRRFHAEPNACPQCGPHLELSNGSGRILATHDEALLTAGRAVRDGGILALKGLGGFQLLVDAGNEGAVTRLRRRKGREQKPFALMYPNLTSVQEHCEVSTLEGNLLQSPAAPIVLLRRKDTAGNRDAAICDPVAPDNPYLGIMLPYTPLHHLLMAELARPVVATSGNRSDEPICIDEHEARQRLSGIADLFLTHNRPVARQVDDSVARVMAGRIMVIRNARGYAPTSIELQDSSGSYLAVGAHLKNAVAISEGKRVLVSQHIGDLDTKQALVVLRKTTQSLMSTYDFAPEAASCDLHPDYASTRFAEGLPIRRISVQHHYAHVLSCMAENDLRAPVLGVAWDGTGLGTDGTVWGGEFLRITDTSFERPAHLRTFRLPGNERAIKEPRRSALGLLYEVYGSYLFTKRDLPPLQAFAHNDLRIIEDMLRRRINAPVTSSAGRLFDAIASLIGVCQKTSFEGQAAMMLEFAAEGATEDSAYPFIVQSPHPSHVIDWQPVVEGILDDLRGSVGTGIIAARFHNTLVEIAVHVAQLLGEPKVVLSGGCFQNRLLTERTIERLQRAGFDVYRHCRIPPNDGGIALGQILAAARARGSS
jgi:hydrogenase maturation protein HypF